MLKWLALLIFAIVVLVAVILAAFGGYELELNPKEFVIKVRPPEKKGECFVEFSDPELAKIVERHIGKGKLVNVRRKATYTIKAIKEDVVVMDVQHEMELKNLSDSSVEEDLEIKVPAHYLEPEVIVDGSVVHPLQISSPSPEEVVRLYRIMIAGKGTRAVTSKLRELRRPLPHTAPDVITRPTLCSELIIEGSPELMKRLHIETVGLTWRDNWEMAKPYTPNRITYGWRSRYPLLPYQGACIHIRMEHQ